MNTTFTPWPNFTDEEANAVRDVILSNKVNYWTGQECRQFEREFAVWAECEFAVALANGTAALEVALRALGIGEGDEVIVTSRTFLASASSIVLVGATPVFVDVDADSQNITTGTIVPAITSRTKAIIAVHLAGWPCSMDSIMKLAENNGLFVIEDCAQAHGARYMGRSVGAYGDIAAWSFCQDKIMTTGGEGGMVTTHNRSLWKRVWSYKDHGKSWDAIYNTEHLPGFRWLHESFGTNWRMTEMQAAIGRIQLRRMPEWHAKRLANAKTIWRVAATIKGLRVPAIPAHIEHAAYKCYVFVEPCKLRSGWNRDRILAQLNEHGVPAYSGSCSEVYLEKAFDGTGLRPPAPLPIAHALGDTSIMFLVHPTLTRKEIDETCLVLKQVMSEAAK